MKKTTKYFAILLLSPSISIPLYLNAQNKSSLGDLKYPSDLENIHIQKLFSDTLSTSFIIWVKKSVKPHKHVYHTESIYVIDGEGVMKVAGIEYKIKSGDFIFIPKNTVHSVEVAPHSILKVLSVQSPEFYGDDRVFVE